MLDKISIRGEVYSRIGGKLLFENQFLQTIVQNQNALFPGYTCIQYSALIETPLGAVRPDLALVDLEGYRDWWIVEVELAHHSLYWHVADQIEKLGHAMLSDSNIEELMNACKDRADQDRLQRLLSETEPSVLCIADLVTQDWKDAVGRDLVRWMEAAPYRSERGDLILRSEDQIAVRTGQVVAHLTPVKGLPGVFSLREGHDLPNLDVLQIEYRGATLLWVIDTQRRIVSPTGDVVMPANRDFQVIRTGRLYRMEPMASGGQS